MKKCKIYLAAIFIMAALFTAYKTWSPEYQDLPVIFLFMYGLQGDGTVCNHQQTMGSGGNH